MPRGRPVAPVELSEEAEAELTRNQSVAVAPEQPGPASADRARMRRRRVEHSRRRTPGRGRRHRRQVAQSVSGSAAWKGCTMNSAPAGREPMTTSGWPPSSTTPCKPSRPRGRTGACARWPRTAGSRRAPCSAGSSGSACSRTGTSTSSCRPTRSSSRRCATSSGSTSTPRTTRWCCASTRRARSRRCSGRSPVLPMGLGYVEGVTHDYWRHGTTTLFAALEVATGTVITDCKTRHRHQ